MGSIKPDWYLESPYSLLEHLEYWPGPYKAVEFGTVFLAIKSPRVIKRAVILRFLRYRGMLAWQSPEDTLVCKKPKDIPIGTSSDNWHFYTRVLDNYLSITPNTEKRLFLKIH